MQVETELTHKKRLKTLSIVGISCWRMAARSCMQAAGKNAYTEAELLVFISDCKNCAVKNYLRTLVEYSYALCKIDKAEQLSDLIAHAWCNLNTCFTEALTLQLFRLLRAMKFSSNDERDLWMNQLFAEEAVHRKQIH